jgi:PAS domain S-box-containing protein
MKANGIVLLLVSSILLTAASAIITHFAIRDSQYRMAWAFETFKAVDRSRTVLELLKDAEISQQEYLLTGDNRYREQFDSLEQYFHAFSDSLQTPYAGMNDETQLLAQGIVQQGKEALAALRQDISRTPGTNLTQAQDRLTKPGIAQQDKTRIAQQALTRHEIGLLTTRLDTLMNRAQAHNIIRYISFVIIILISVLALGAIIRYSRQNKMLVAELSRGNFTLAKKVEERTQELKRQSDVTEELNEELRLNMEELSSFYEALQVRNAKAEDALHEIQDLYHHAACGYHSISHDGLILRMNQTELNWLGYTADEVLGKMKITEMLIPEDHMSYIDDFQLFKDQGFIRNKEHTFLRKDRTTFSGLLSSTALYDSDGEYRMSRGTVVDITERKKAELKLIELNNNLKHVNEEKDNFLSVAAHDLKSPVNNMLGLLNVLTMGQSNLTPDQEAIIGRMRKVGASMQTLITNLLDITRIEQGLNVLNPEEVQLSPLLRQCAQSFHDHAHSKGIKLQLADSTADARIITDASALQRILENLLSNAIKFSPADKVVTIRLMHEDNSVSISVIDQGPGISTEDMGKLFRKFQKLAARPTNGESSTGLGLSIVKELVQAMNGKISVNSKPGIGTTFTVELPLLLSKKPREVVPV